MKQYRERNSSKISEQRRKYRKLWYEQNKAKVIEDSKKYYLSNRAKVLEYKKIWTKDNAESVSKRIKQWKKDNVEHLRKRSADYMRNRAHSDPLFRFTKNLRRRLHHAFKNMSKSRKTLDLLGCTIEEAYRHVESLFQPGMTWENYGKWHVDHIIPFAVTQLAHERERLCHYTNLQPLWAADNLKKGTKLGDNLNIQEALFNGNS